MKKFLLISFLISLVVAGYLYYGYTTKVTRCDLPAGELKWSNVKPKNAKMCLPAAFKDTDNNILGAYRIDGKIVGKSKRNLSKISLTGDSFIVTNICISY